MSAEIPAAHAALNNGPAHAALNNGPAHAALNNGPAHAALNNGPAHAALNNGPAHGAFDDSPAHAAPVSPATPHILIVDDATVVRLYYRRILEAEGWRVEESINGIEGMERALQSRFDLCVVDVNMPVMNGYAFMHALRREPITHAVPALMISTQASIADRNLALQAGANFYLIKPVAQARLAAVAAAMLGRPGAKDVFGNAS